MLHHDKFSKGLLYTQRNTGTHSLCFYLSDIWFILLIQTCSQSQVITYLRRILLKGEAWQKSASFGSYLDNSRSVYVHIMGENRAETIQPLDKALCLYFTNTLSRMNKRTCTIALLAHSCCYVATSGYRRANGGISTQALYWDDFIHTPP